MAHIDGCSKKYLRAFFESEITRDKLYSLYKSAFIGAYPTKDAFMKATDEVLKIAHLVLEKKATPHLRALYSVDIFHASSSEYKQLNEHDKLVMSKAKKALKAKARNARLLLNRIVQRIYGSNSCDSMVTTFNEVAYTFIYFFI